jgi:hypothetical protein
MGANRAVRGPWRRASPAFHVRRGRPRSCRLRASAPCVAEPPGFHARLRPAGRPGGAAARRCRPARARRGRRPGPGCARARASAGPAPALAAAPPHGLLPSRGRHPCRGHCRAPQVAGAPWSRIESKRSPATRATQPKQPERRCRAPALLGPALPAGQNLFTTLQGGPPGQPEGVGRPQQWVEPRPAARAGWRPLRTGTWRPRSPWAG